MRGSYPWTYHLGERGQVILRDSQVVDTGWRYRPHVVHEFGHVLHDLQLNAWLLAYRRQPGVGFLAWEGERTIEPPPTTREERAEPRWLPAGSWTVHGLHDYRHRPVRPDAVIELDRGEWVVPHTQLIEFDRTRRVDKNFEKVRRYDTFLVWWWNLMEEALHASEPYVIFVCQDEDQLDQFLHAADYELTGHHDCLDHNRDRFVGRNRILFAVEQDMHAGRLDARAGAGGPAGPPQPRQALPRAQRRPHGRLVTGPEGGSLLVLISNWWSLGVGPWRSPRRRPAPVRDAASRLNVRGRGVHRFALDPPSSTCQ
jgi:hypothetical protein